MTREEFMTEAKAEIGAVATTYTNRILNLVARAYAVGKRNVEELTGVITDDQIRDAHSLIADAIRANNRLTGRRLDEILVAEAEGRLLILPCKVGDTVYKVWYDPCHKGETHPDSYGCSGCDDVCDIKKSIHELKAPSVDWILRQLHNGSLVYFLTREEAERALKEARR